MEGQEAWSAGFFTLSSAWQQYSTFFNAAEGQRLAFSCVRTAEVSSLWMRLAADEGLPPPNPKRAVSWYWTNYRFTNESSIEFVIARAKSLGCRLLFFLQMTSDLGDYVADATRFPSGFARTADRVRAAGLDLGLHIISPGASIGTPASKAYTDLFVPQGVTTRDYYAGTDAGTWWLHEGHGATSWDHTRHIDTILPPSEQPPPPNPIHWHGGVGWSPLGRFRNGSAALFNGATSYGELTHQAEYDFGAEFSLQMVVHVNASSPRRRNETLAAKAGAWKLVLNPSSILEWHVHFAVGGWRVARGHTPLRSAAASAKHDPAYVVKATVGGGLARIWLCELVDKVVGKATTPVKVRNRCDMYKEGQAPPAPSPGLQNSTAAISIGADLVADADAPRSLAMPFTGALEEIMLSKVRARA